MHIVFLDAQMLGPDVDFSRFQSLGEVTVFDNTSAAQTIERSKAADIVITSKVVFDQNILKNLPRLQLICVAATGTNNIDIKAAEKQKVIVKNVADYATTSVAEHTFALLFTLIHQTRYYDEYVWSGDYAASKVFTHLDQSFFELCEKTWGIIGMGNIGQEVARLATAFGAEVIYFSTSGKNTKQSYSYVSLAELLQQSDVISIHAPLNAKTKNLIAANELQQMKSSALLLNLGRGGIINEVDLAAALNKNTIAGAGLDVFSSEPLDADNPLVSVQEKEKLVFSPHIAWASKEARQELMESIAKNIKEFLSASK